jgi:hypothetical protein
MTPHPQDEAEDRKDPGGKLVDGGDAARQVAHVTGMSADSARTFAAFVSGRYAPSSAFRLP